MHALLVVLFTYAPPSGHAADRLAQATQALARAVRASGVEVAEGAVAKAEETRAAGFEPEATFAFFAGGRRALDDGRSALERVELDRAVAAFGRAEAIYGAHLDRPGAATLDSDAALGRGVALFELGRSDEAATAFQKARALEPAALLTTEIVRPDIARAFAQAVAPAHTAPLSVRLASDTTATSPITATSAVTATSAATATSGTQTAAEVRVNGRSVGRAPIAIEVPVGPCFVEVRAPGRTTVARLVEVAPSGMTIAAALPIDPVLSALRALQARPSGAGVRALAAELDTPKRRVGALAVAIGVDAGVLTLVGQRFDEQGCASRAEVVTAQAGLDRAASELVARLATRPVSCGPNAPASDGRLVMEAQPIAHPRAERRLPPVPRRRRVRFYERPWLWAGLLAASSLAVGLAAGLAQPSPSYRATADGNAFSH